MHPQSNDLIWFQTSKFNIELTALDNKLQHFDRKLLGSQVKRVGDDQEDDYPTGYFYTSQDYLELETSEIKQFGYILLDTKN